MWHKNTHETNNPQCWTSSSAVNYLQSFHLDDQIHNFTAGCIRQVILWWRRCNLQSDFFTSCTCTLAFFFFHKRHSILHLYRKVTTYRQITDTPNTVTKIENKTTSIKLLHNNYLYTCTNKQFWFDLENVFFYESFPSDWHNNWLIRLHTCKHTCTWTFL